MKRQRPYGDGLDEDDRRKFYNRGPPPPPPRLPPREHEGDRFDRRKGFGGGGSYDNRYREYPSPREYGWDRALHRSESFAGFRREFRSERDRPRRDGDGSSAWRRPGGGWRDAEGLGERRSPARPSGALMPAPPQRSRSPTERRRRLEVAKADKSRKHSASTSKMEEGEVAPDAEHKARPARIEHRKPVLPSRAKQKGPEGGEAKKVESGVSMDSGTQCKGVPVAPRSDNASSEQGERRDGLVVEAGKAMGKGHEKSALKVEEEGEGRHQVQSLDVAASDLGKFGLSTSAMQQEVLQEKVKPHEEATNSVSAIEQSSSTRMLVEVIQEETSARAEITHDIDEIGKSDSSSSRQGATQVEAAVLHKTGCAAAEVGKSSSTITEQVGLEQSLALDGADLAVDEVGKSVSCSIVDDVLQEEVMQCDGTANAIDGEIDTSGMLQEAMQEKMAVPDEIINSVDNHEPASFSGLMKEVMHDEDLAPGGTASTAGEAGQFISSDTVEDVMRKKAVTLEEVTNVAGESNMSTKLQEEVVSCLPQQPLENIELENLSVIKEKMSEPTECVASQPVEERTKGVHCEKRGVPVEATLAEGAAVMHDENVERQVKIFDMEVKTESAEMFLQPTKEHAVAEGRKEEATNTNVMTEEPMAKDKGNDISFDVLYMKDNADLTETVGRGTVSTLQLCTELTETSKSASTTFLKQEHEAIKIGKLDLSLSLSGCLQNSESKPSTPKTGSSLVHTASSQLLPSSPFHTNSDGFTASMSLTNSQTLGHNPSCSLTQQSLDNYEHSVGSKPLFTGVDQIGNCVGWQAQLSSESTQKGGATPHGQRLRQNGHVPDNTLVGISGHIIGMSKDLQRLASIPGVSSPTSSRGSQDSGLEHSRFRRQLTRERSSSSLTRGARQVGEQLVINGSGVVERIISKVVSEPFQLTARMLQEMTENSIRYLREAISEIIVDVDKRGQITALQEALKKRSDLNSDMLRKCPHVLMEILVAIKTGLPYFVKKSSSIALSDLVDIFLDMKCCNISCRSVLPVDDCDCKFCQQKTGFCSSCMCIVCSKFDSASNTCSWVGCDVCLHWSHTDCGLRHSLIRKGQSSSKAYNNTEIQFHCAACGHPSEMFGFVKEVFRACARQWRMDTLVRELQYVERVFSYSDDAKGKRVWDFVKQMLIKLEKKAYYPEVLKYVIAFFSGKLLIYSYPCIEVDCCFSVAICKFLFL
jgi:hypothetical protein